MHLLININYIRVYIFYVFFISQYFIILVFYIILLVISIFYELSWKLLIIILLYLKSNYSGWVLIAQYSFI